MPEITVDPTTPTRNQCRHIRTSGHRCGSPALRQQNFCYYHYTTRKPVSREERDRRTQSISQAEARHQTFDLPLPEDRAAIQLSIGEILRRIALNQIDPRRAGLLLYGLQIAALNLPPQPRTTPESTTSEQLVDEITKDELYGPLAPESPMPTLKVRKTLEQILNEQWEKDKEEERQTAGHPTITPDEAPEDAPDQTAAEAEGSPWAHSIPTLQATATRTTPPSAPRHRNPHPLPPAHTFHPNPTRPAPSPTRLFSAPTP